MKLPRSARDTAMHLRLAAAGAASPAYSQDLRVLARIAIAPTSTLAGVGWQISSIKRERMSKQLESQLNGQKEGSRSELTWGVLRGWGLQGGRGRRGLLRSVGLGVASQLGDLRCEASGGRHTLCLADWVGVSIVKHIYK